MSVSAIILLVCDCLDKNAEAFLFIRLLRHTINSLDTTTQD